MLNLNEKTLKHKDNQVIDQNVYKETYQSFQIQSRFKDRITHVEEEIVKINVIMHDFLNIVTHDFNRMVIQSVQMHENLVMLKEMVH